jgi:hypothetical protein|tara:strand:- start:613 stop:909 length:297 start_codon:yes stop_codon:yes gene_type:complete
LFSLLSGALLAKTLSLLFLRGRALGFLYVPLLLFALLECPIRFAAGLLTRTTVVILTTTKHKHCHDKKDKFAKTVHIFSLSWIDEPQGALNLLSFVVI